MNERQLCERAAEMLKEQKYKKKVPKDKFTFHISDDFGNEKDFAVSTTERHLSLNYNDVHAVLEAVLEAARESLRRGESVEISGFGRLMLKAMDKKKIQKFGTGEYITVKRHYNPRFVAGAQLFRCANMYENSLTPEQLDRFQNADDWKPEDIKKGNGDE